jgi:hypothetical protein
VQEVLLLTCIKHVLPDTILYQVSAGVQPLSELVAWLDLHVNIVEEEVGVLVEEIREEDLEDSLELVNRYSI